MPTPGKPKQEDTPEGRIRAVLGVSGDDPTPLVRLEPLRRMDPVEDYEPEETYGLICEAMQGGERIELPLDRIDFPDDGPNRRLLEDYRYWMHNWA